MYVCIQHVDFRDRLVESGWHPSQSHGSNFRCELDAFIAPPPSPPLASIPSLQSQSGPSCSCFLAGQNLSQQTTRTFLVKEGKETQGRGPAMGEWINEKRRANWTYFSLSVIEDPDRMQGHPVKKKKIRTEKEKHERVKENRKREGEWETRESKEGKRPTEKEIWRLGQWGGAFPPLFLSLVS